MTAILETRALEKSFGGLGVTKRIDLALRPGETQALIGPNGAGKTTFINLLTGQLRPSGGTILLDGQDITRLPGHRRIRRGLARTFQISTLLDGFTAEKSVMLALLAREGRAFGLGRMARMGALRERAGEWLDRVGLAASAGRPTRVLSHGEHRQLELAMALALEPKVLLLDEPMAGLAGEETAQMVALLREIRPRYSILLVEHDMDAVFALADRISVLSEGALVATGTAEEIRANPQVKAAYFGTDHDL